MKVELLDSHAITSKLSGYWRVSILDEIASTQSELKNRNPENWDLLVTEFQSAGRGRLDRTFEAPKNSALLFSFYITPNRNRGDWGFIPLLAGAAVANSVNRLTDSKDYSCKWPNDLLANNKKIAGLLSESFGDGVVIGIGINVSIEDESLPTPQASSIFLESKKLLDRNDLLAEVCNEFKSIFESWDAGEDLLSYYKNTSATLNSKVKAIQPTGEVSGLAIDILPTGALLLEGEVEITVGDLIHLRD